MKLYEIIDIKMIEVNNFSHCVRIHILFGEKILNKSEKLKKLEKKTEQRTGSPIWCIEVN